MDATELRALQAPLKDRYKKEPIAALVTLKAKGVLNEGLSCKVETGPRDRHRRAASGDRRLGS